MAGESWLELAYVILFGLVMGSFATALSWRIPRGQAWFIAGKSMVRSACSHCGVRLGARDMIPLLSWLLTRGKCRHCGVSYGGRYPAIELATLLCCIGIYFVWGFTFPAFIMMASMPFLVALFAIDVEYFILPDQLIIILAGFALFLIAYQLVVYGSGFGFEAQAVMKLSGAVVFAGLAAAIRAGMNKLLSKDSLGMGDIKFFALAGLWLGLAYLPFFLLVAGMIGVIWGAFYNLALKKTVFPFGPALILTLYAGLILQGLDIVPLAGIE